jgi:tetratricopeptide (TPR) repeat protein
MEIRAGPRSYWAFRATRPLRTGFPATECIPSGTWFADTIASIHNNRAFAYQGKGQLEKALMDYNEAIRIEPKYAIAYSIRGSAYSSLGKGVGHRL